MKPTGIVRKLDELGRVVIPAELRRTLGIGEKDPIEIYVDGERVILKKHRPGCVFCGEAREIVGDVMGKLVCRPCVEKLAAIEFFNKKVGFGD